MDGGIKQSAARCIERGGPGLDRLRLGWLGVIKPAALLHVMGAKDVNLRESLLCSDGHSGSVAFIVQID
jgi:hypothetical protein